MSTETKYYEWAKASEELPERYKVVACRVLYEDIDSRQDWELHWLYVDKNDKWQHIKTYSRIEWLRPVNLSDIIREAGVVCMEGGCDNPATKDYNGHNHWVCDKHYDKLNDEFDEEYR